MSNKFLIDTQVTSSPQDKFFIMAKTKGDDYHISPSDVITYLKQTLLKDYLLTEIGDTYINMNNTYRDQINFTKGYFKYLLYNGQTINKSDYPDLFNALGVDDDTYILPNYSAGEGCAMKHIKEGDGRNLGSYEEDAIKAHVHNATHGHTSPAHSHAMWHGHAMDHEHTQNLPGRNGKDGYNQTAGWGMGDMQHSNATATTEGGRPYTGGVVGGPNGDRTENIAVTINNYTGNTGSTGGTKTRMENLAVQIYIKAKVIM